VHYVAFVLFVVVSSSCETPDDEPHHRPRPQELARSVVEVQMMSGGEMVAHGSGSVISKTGLILTNAHVATPDPVWHVDDLVIAVTERPRKPPVPRYHAEVVASDPDLDLALLRPVTTLDGDPFMRGDLRSVRIGDSGDVRLGDKIWILGYPSIGGATVTITVGLVSGFNSDANIEGRAWIKTDATIAGGNSGGMALNRDGELIGIPTIAAATPELDDITDCRRIQDTNQDGLLNRDDSCIPLGGFLNGIRPVNLAQSMIHAALPDDGGERTAEPEPVVEGFDVDGVEFRSLVFDDVTPKGQPAGNIWLPSGTSRICAWWRYRGMAEGVRFDAL
jgi:S1-C subfamily serine protease